LRGKMRQNTAYTHCESVHRPRSVCCSSMGFTAGNIPVCRESIPSKLLKSLGERCAATAARARARELNLQAQVMVMIRLAAVRHESQIHYNVRQTQMMIRQSECIFASPPASGKPIADCGKLLELASTSNWPRSSIRGSQD
jgi:hypothetical protein